MTRDLYKLLGVTSDASAAQLRRAFRKMSKRYHPDMPTGDEAKFRDIEEAYRILSDDNERAYYDANGKVRERDPESNANSELYQMLAATMAQAIQGMENPAANDLIAAMRQVIVRARKALVKQVKQGNETLRKLQVIVGRIKSKTPDNVLRSLLASEIAGLETMLKRSDHQFDVMKKGDEFLKDYSYETDKLLGADFGDGFAAAVLRSGGGVFANQSFTYRNR